jgi:hypothetical protein
MWRFISFQAEEEKSVSLNPQRYRHDTILRRMLGTLMGCRVRAVVRRSY